MGSSSEAQKSEWSPETGEKQQTKKPRRERTGRKRSYFKKPPDPAWPVRGLWESAPEKEKERAHQTCMAILEYWLGKKTKGQVAEDLGVNTLRVWQLSQRAVSGMLAGLLSQPRRRVNPEIFLGRGWESPAALKRRITVLEKELSRTEDLVRVLRTAPWVPVSSESLQKGGASRGSKKKGRGGKASPKGRATPNRSLAPEPPTLEKGIGGDG